MPTPSNILCFHCCCAPCTLMPLEQLHHEGWQLTLYYSNPNIHPAKEYLLRLETLQRYADKHGVPLVAPSYNPRLWEEQVGVYGGPFPLIQDAVDYKEMLAARRRRCRACYEIRFKATAEYACSEGLSTIASTLAISPYQFTEDINSILAAQAQSQGIRALRRDWRELYSEATRTSRELGMYRQNYCGCRFSQLEAKLERDARKADKKKQRADERGRKKEH